jgi:hypothetical protein
MPEGTAHHHSSHQAIHQANHHAAGTGSPAVHPKGTPDPCVKEGLATAASLSNPEACWEADELETPGW